MKRILFAAALAQVTYSASAELIITGVFDGPLSGGVPKGIELYVAADIPDLSVYGIESANNGNAAAGAEFTFPAVAASAGQYIYIASEATGFSDFFGFAPDYTSAAMSINGDDAIVLYLSGVASDVFGVIGEDGSGQAWEYLDGWAYRNNGVAPNTSFDLAEWRFSSPNALDGAIDNVSAITPIPLASYSGSGDGGGDDVAVVIINEVDADTAGTDILEFVELYDGGRGNTDLSGLSVVLYNGSDDASYDALDLDGYTTNSEGYFVLGNPGVTNVDLVIGSSNIIQNGADAVALVMADAADYPNDTPVSVDNVLDAVVYGTNDADDAALLILLNAGQPQLDEDAAGDKDNHSNQRCENGEGGARNTAGFVQALATPGEANLCTPAINQVFISEVQGNPATYGTNSFGETDVSPLLGQQVVVEGIVVGDFQDGDSDDSRNLSGFYLQEEAADEDGDPLSSEGVFVFDSAFGVDVQLGDQVRVTGTVDQYFGETQIDSVTAVEVLGTNRLAEVNPAQISLLGNSAVSIDQGGNYQPDLEAYEGMLVTLLDTLTINEQFQLDRFNEIKLVAGERPYQFTQLNTPDATLFDQFQQSLGARRITYDDGLNVQNANIGLLDGFADYNEANAKRMGDTVAGLQGVLDYKWAGNSASGATWRVRSHRNGANEFTSTQAGNSPNPRPATPPELTGNLKVASFNVLNFFNTLDESGVVTAVGMDPRGADSAAEFDRQLLKLTNTLVALDADVLGLVELENEFAAVEDGSTAIDVLVDALNEVLGAGVYASVYPGQQFVGTDAISVGFIYKPAVVSLAEGSSVALLDDTVAATLDVFASRDFAADPIFDGEATNRVSMAVSFVHLASSDQFTVVANHFKSKGSSGLSDALDPNFDQQDGAGFWNQRRTDAAVAVSEWVSTFPTGIEDNDVIVLGDLNAYAMESPVQYLLANGYHTVEEPEAYSYTFDGQIGTLDYLLVSDSLLEKMTGASLWHINSDEADALDYNLDFGKSALYFDGTTATRNSDHDPLMVGLEMQYQSTSIAELIAAYRMQLAAGDIVGRGKSPWLQTLNVIRFQVTLRMAESFEQRGKIQQSCHFLNKANRYSDGNASPKDLLEGAGVIDLNKLVNKAAKDLGCSGL